MGIALVVLGLAGAAYFAFGRKTESTEERAAKMAMLADVIYRLAMKKPVTPAERQAAIDAANHFSLPKTAKGIASDSGLPNDEIWPGTQASVAAYMLEYINRNKPPAPNAPPPAPKPAAAYNDEAPIPPYDDPRKFRAQAVDMDKKGNKVAAKVLHVKADTLNKLIRSAKTAAAAKAGAKDIAASVKSLFSMKQS